jgi:hypothetical protein
MTIDWKTVLVQLHEERDALDAAISHLQGLVDEHDRGPLLSVTKKPTSCRSRHRRRPTRESVTK